jgi:hypothetical protein
MRGALLGILAGGLALAAAQPAAAAAVVGSVNINGPVIANPTSSDVSLATSLDFTTTGLPTPGVAGSLSQYVGNLNSVPLFCTGVCGTIQDISSLVTGPLAISNFFVLIGAPVSFDLASINLIDRSTAGFLNVSATGTINVTGYDPTPAVFSFSTQGRGLTTFSASTVAVPEPATWALMLVGFAGIGMAMRRRRRPALAQLA